MIICLPLNKQSSVIKSLAGQRVSEKTKSRDDELAEAVKKMEELKQEIERIKNES